MTVRRSGCHGRKVGNGAEEDSALLGMMVHWGKRQHTFVDYGALSGIAAHLQGVLRLTCEK